MPLTIKGWGERKTRETVKALADPDVIGGLDSLISRATGVGGATWWNAILDRVTKMIEVVSNAIQLFQAPVIKMSATTINQITGINITDTEITATINTPPGRTQSLKIGQAFLPVLDNMFPLGPAVEDAKNRVPSENARDNIKTYFGTNLMFQLRSLTIATIASFVPYFQLRHLEGLHQTINWAFGFGWLSWSVMSAVMEITTTNRLRQYYWRQIKPNDYNEGDAYNALIQGRITPTIFGEVLDNHGQRDDIRPVLQAMREKEFDEQDIELYWRRGWITSQDVYQWARWKGFPDARAKLKQKQIENAQIWEILNKITATNTQLYTDCVISADQLRTWLKSVNWRDQDIDAQIALAELSRRKRHFLSLSEVGQAVDYGLMDFSEAYDHLLCQGYEDQDAIIALLVYEIKHVPKECLDKIKPGDISGLIGAIIAGLGLKGILHISPSLVKLAQCLGTLPVLPGPPTTKEPPKPHAPSGNFAIVPSIIIAGEQTRMTWNIDHADPGKITIDGEGNLPAEGVRFLTSTENHIFRLEAEGPGGKNVFLASVLVRPAKVEGPPVKAPHPTVSLTISPARVTVGDLVEVRWNSNHAETAFLDTGLGARAVATQGALLWVAEKNVIMTITATGPGGSRSSSDSLVVRPAALEEGKHPVPTAALTISPGRAHPGDLVEVRWTSSNADTVTLNFGSGDTQVGVTGARVIPAAQTTIMTLTATGPGGTRQSMDALIVIPRPPEPPPSEPAPQAELSITPSRGKRGIEYAVTWRTTHATHVTLQGAGALVAIEPAGARKVEATSSALWVLTATGPGGTAASYRVFILVEDDTRR